MKKSRFVTSIIASASVALFVFSSCVKEETSISGQLKQKGDMLYRFTATPDNALTKAFAEINDGYSNGDVVWEEDDQVAVCNGHDVVVFDFMGYNSSGLAEFRSMNGIQYKYDCGLVMVYPASLVSSPGDWTLSGSTVNVKVTLPRTQPFTSNERCSYAPMIAHVGKEDIEKYKVNNVYFKNMCGLLGIKISGDVDKQQSSAEGLKNIVFSTTQKCSGKGTVSITKDNSGSSFNPVLSMGSGADSYSNVTLDFSTVNSAPPETSGRWYYFYLPAGTYTTPTLAVNFKKANSNMVDRVVNSNLTIVRNVLSHGNNFFQTLFSGGGATGSATGTEANPYLIKDLDDLLELSAKVNAFNATYLAGTSSAEEASPSAAGVTYNTSGKYYKLVNSLTLTPAFLSQFKPIGTSANPFKGTFDGNGKTITGFTYTSSSESTGFFGVVEGGTVKNLVLSNVNVQSSARYLGAFAGWMKSGSKLLGCTLTAGGSGTSIVKQTGTGEAAVGTGGLVGYLTDASTIRNSETRGGMTGTNTITIESASDQVGGIVGRSITGTIANSPTTRQSSTVTIKGVSRVGGIVGHQNSGYVRCNDDGQTNGLCVNQANITGSGNYIGGIAGSINTQAEISLVTNRNDIFNGGTITGGASSNGVGGIIGSSTGGVITISAGATANNKAVKGAKYVGGIIGYINDASNGTTTLAVSGTYDTYFSNTGAITGTESVGGVAGKINTDKTTISGFKNSGTVTSGTSATASDNIYCGGIAGYVKGGTITGCRNLGNISGNGRVGGIVGEAESVTISGSSSQGNITSVNKGAGGILGYQTSTTGTVKITGLGNDTSAPTYSGGTVTVSSTVRTFGCGGIIGAAYGNVTISNCAVASATVTTVNSNNVGGIAGFVGPTGDGSETVKTSGWKSTVQNCTVAANCTISAKQTGTDQTQSGKFAAGICGEIDDCRLTNCTNYGTVSSASSVAGGIAGLNHGSIENCYSYGKVSSGQTGAGGIAGIMMSRGRIMKCHSYGGVSAKNDRVGGIVGAMYSETSEGQELTTNKSYTSGCEVHSNGQTITGDNCVGGIVGYVNSTGKAPTKSGAATSKETLAFSQARGVVYDCKVGVDGSSAITIKSTRSNSVFGLVGGIVGGIDAPAGAVTVGLCQVGAARTSSNSASLPKITSTTGYVGGIVGSNSCRDGGSPSTKGLTISYCYFCANVSTGASGSYSLGGILGDTGGHAKATITKCAVYQPNLTSKYYNADRMAGVGGIVGRASSSLTVSDCTVLDMRNATTSTTGNFITMSGGTASGNLGGFGALLGYANSNCSALSITNCVVHVGTTTLKLGSGTDRPSATNYGTYRYSHIVGYSSQTSTQTITIVDCYWRNSMAPINRANTGNMDLYEIVANIDDSDYGKGAATKKVWSPANGIPSNNFSAAINCAASAIVNAKDTHYNTARYLYTFLNHKRTDEESTAGFSWKKNTKFSDYVMYDCGIPGLSF